MGRETQLAHIVLFVMVLTAHRHEIANVVTTVSLILEVARVTW